MVLETDHVRLQSMYLDGSDTFSTFGKHIRVTDLIAWRIFPQLLAKVSALALQERMSK